MVSSCPEPLKVQPRSPPPVRISNQLVYHYSRSRSSTFMSPSTLEVNAGQVESERRSDKDNPSGDVASLLPLCISYWDRKKFLSDFIADGLEYLDDHRNDASNQEPRRRHRRRAIMLYEAPSTYATGTTFHNSRTFRVHDYPPAPVYMKTVMDPCRYSLANGSAYPSYLKDGGPPTGLLEHWEETIPDWVKPSFTNEIRTLHSDHNHPDASDDDPAGTDPVLVFAYLPCEAIAGGSHVNDPAVHHYLTGKDVLPRITNQTPRLLPSTRPRYRPCLVKTTHSSGSRGIFAIRTDPDEQAFEAYWEDAHHPQFVVTELVSDIRRNVACHFFIHPNGHNVTVLGSSENFRYDDNDDDDAARHGPRNPILPFSSDSYWSWSDQDVLRDLQAGLVQEVARYCHSLGFWGFCGIDVLLDESGRTHLIDVNPRVTGSLPSMLVANLFHDRFGFECGIFRRSGPATYYHGPSRRLLEEVAQFNRTHTSECQVVVFSFFELPQQHRTVTKIQLGVYGRSMDQCRKILGEFANELEEE